MRPHSLAVLGLGAIGGSLAWQARLAGVPSVIGYAPDRADSVQALKSQAVHDIADSPARAVQGADLVVLAAPPRAILELLTIIAPNLSPGALITDVASIKAPVMARAREVGLAESFAGSHPFAGTHVAGWSGARPDRFTGAIVYVSATGPTGDRAAREIMNFWQAVLHAHPVLVDAEVHDAQLAWTSHLPQAVASVLAHALGREQALRGASFGTGMRDTTRLAASPAEMWVDIFLMNAGPCAKPYAGLRVNSPYSATCLIAVTGTASRPLLEEGAAFRRRLDGDTPPTTPGSSPR